MGLTEIKDAALQSPKTSYFREKIWPALEKFIIAGPTFVGFVLGLWKYPPGHRYFETAFQSLVFFALYIAVLMFMQAVDSLFLSSWPIVLGVVRSILATLYLVATLKQYLEFRSRETKIYAITGKFRNRLARVIESGNAR